MKLKSSMESLLVRRAFLRKIQGKSCFISENSEQMQKILMFVMNNNYLVYFLEHRVKRFHSLYINDIYFSSTYYYFYLIS